MKKLISKFQPGGSAPTPGSDYDELRSWMKGNLSDEEISGLNLHKVTPDLLIEARANLGDEGTIAAIRDITSKGLELKANPKETPVELSSAGEGKGNASVFSAYIDKNKRNVHLTPNNNYNFQFFTGQDSEGKWKEDPYMKGRMVSLYNEVAESLNSEKDALNQFESYDDDKWYNFVGNLYDLAVSWSNKHYNSPLGGALARWQASWHNNTNPVKASLEKTPAMVPGVFLNALVGLFGDLGVKKTGRLLQDLEKNPVNASDRFMKKVLPSMAGDVLNLSTVAAPIVTTSASLTLKGIDKLLYDPKFEKILSAIYGDQKAWEISEKIKAIGMEKWYRENPLFEQDLRRYINNSREQDALLDEAFAEGYPMALKAEDDNAYRLLMQLKRDDPEAYKSFLAAKRASYSINSYGQARNTRTGSFVDIVDHSNAGTIHVNLKPGNRQETVDPVLLLFAKKLIQNSPKGTQVNGTNANALGYNLSKQPKRSNEGIDEYIRSSLNKTDNYNLTMSSVNTTQKTGSYPGFTVTYPKQQTRFNDWNRQTMMRGSLYTKLRPQILRETAAKDSNLAQSLKEVGIDVSKPNEHIEERVQAMIKYSDGLSKKVNDGKWLTPEEEKWQWKINLILSKIPYYLDAKWSPEFRKILVNDKNFGTKGSSFPIVELGNGNYTVKSPTAVHLDYQDASPTLALMEKMGVPTVRDTWINDLYKQFRPFVNWTPQRKNGGKLIPKNNK